MEQSHQAHASRRPTGPSKRRFFGIRSQLLLLVVAAMLPLLLLGALNIREQLASARTAQAVRAIAAAREFAALIDRQLGATDAVLLSLVPALSLNLDDLRKNQTLLQTVHGDLPMFHLSLKAFTKEGGLLGASDGSEMPTENEAKYLRGAEPGRTLTPAAVPERLANGRYTLRLARRLWDAEGRPVGSIVATVDLAMLQGLMEMAVLPAGALVTVVNERRLVLARSRDAGEWVGRSAATPGALGGLDGSAGTEGGTASPVNAMNRLGGALCTVAPWRVYIDVPVPGAAGLLFREFRSTVVVGLTAVVAALALAWLIAGRITRPILRLAADARVFATGESRRRTRVMSRDEVGEFARTFNRMLDGIDRRDAALRASESRYRTLIDCAPEAIFVLDVATGLFVDHNPGAERLFKLDGDALRRSGPKEVWPASQPDGRGTQEVVQPYLQQAIDGGAPAFELTLLNAEAEEIPCEVRLLRLPAENRVLVRGTVTAITDRKQAELRLTETLTLQRAILDHAGYAVISTTPAGIITSFNPAAERLLGYAAAEVIGRHTAPLIHGPREIVALTAALSPELGGMIAPGFEVFLARAGPGGAAEEEWTYIRKDSSRVPVQLAVTALRNSGGQIAGFVGMAIDITERRRAEQQLVHERTVLELVARGTALTEVLTALITGHETLYPKTFGAVMLLTADGKYFAQSVSPTLPPEFCAAFAGMAVEAVAGSCGTAAATGKTVVVTDIATDPRWDDCRHHAEPHGLRACWSTPIRSGQGAVLGTFALYYRTVKAPQAHELTAIESSARLAGLALESRRTEVARGELERKLLETQKLESLGVLAGGIAHDFNNLLTGILGNSSLAGLDLPADSPIQHYLEQINHSSLRAADLCKQMLAYSGKGRFVVQKIDLNSLVRETTDLLHHSISKKAVLNFELADDLPGFQADLTQIRQLVMNLVINASEALGERGGTIRVITRVRQVDRDYLSTTSSVPETPAGEYVSLEVVDDGCGMSAETQAKMFDPFFTTKFTGRGLGLAVVLGIMRGHKGALKVYSEPGRGTTFELLFPSVEDSEEGSEESFTGSRPPWRGRGTVLVVDDEEIIRGMCSRMLQMLGFETALVADGREAVALYGENPDRFTLVLLDLTMPHMDGEETFTALRRIDSSVRVILMSGYNRQESVAGFTGKGLASFLQKPFTLEALREGLQAALGAGG